MATIAKVGNRKIILDGIEMHSVRSVDYKVSYNAVDTVFIEIIVGKIDFSEDTITIKTANNVT